MRILAFMLKYTRQKNNNFRNLKEEFICTVLER
nr:MAG TPA: hypothetical protein [Caudoviricetes sp.]